MNTKLLKQKVLDLAIHGKLVPQDSNDEPAFVLLEKIRAEKEEKIKKGELKRDKKETYIIKDDNEKYFEKFEDGSLKEINNEISFDLPSNWQWFRLKELSDSILYGISESAKEKGNYKLLRITDIQNNSVNWDEVPYTNYEGDIDKYLLHNNDIVFARTGATVGKSFLINDLKYKATYASYLIRIRPIKSINPNYIKYYFGTTSYWNQITDKSAGIGQPNVNGTSLSNLFIPLPPIEEQQRIVNQIEKIFAQIDLLEENQSDLSELIDKSKAKILDLAIHGKLVEQDANDEPASVLLEKIRVEKEEKIKKGELKRDKKESNLIMYNGKVCEKFFDGKIVEVDDEIPFKLPNSWCWARGKEIFKPMASIKPMGNTFKYIDIDAIDNKNHSIKAPKVIEVVNAPSRASRKVEIGDTLFSLVRPYLENIAYVEEENSDCIASTGFFVCKPNKELYSKYIYYVMISNYTIKGVNQFMKGDNSPSVQVDDLNNWLYPLPPVEEQKRIVLKIEFLFNLLNGIKEHLS